MKKVLVIFALIILTFCLPSCEEADPLDEILDYTVTVDTYDDATLFVTYRLSWKVLDDVLEGPLSWVKIGVPNRFVEEITPLSPFVVKAEYNSEDGAFVNAYLDREYYAGETVEIAFSLHQKRIFTIDDNLVQFEFIPGWFEEISVDKLTVLWNAEDVYYCNTATVKDGYYVWATSLRPGESTSVRVSYDKSHFPTINESEDYSDSALSSFEIAMIFVGIFGSVALFATVLVASTKLAGGGYYAHRGYYGTRYYHHHFFYHGNGVNKSGKKLTIPQTTNSGSGHSGHSCACACACACAGGGRAGCSRKDFTRFPELGKITEELKK